MTDKEKIREEIERRINLLKNGDADPEVLKRVEGVLLAYNSVLQFINSLPEEPSTKVLEEEATRFVKTKEFYESEENPVVLIARHFAEWQKEKDKQLVGATQKISHQHGYGEGRADMREEIMKDAVEGIVGGHTDIPAFINLEIEHKPNVKVGDKVKIIIVKENML